VIVELLVNAHERHPAKTFFKSVLVCMTSLLLGDVIMLARINQASNGRL